MSFVGDAVYSGVYSSRNPCKATQELEVKGRKANLDIGTSLSWRLTSGVTITTVHSDLRHR
jgi:hypothetical protein